MNNPIISVIIPLYNKEPIIERTVRSVLSQSYKDFELIVVDDGSTDNSVAVFEHIQDERITIIKQENGGPGSARNTGVAHAKGDWIIFLDADDELLPNALQTYGQLLLKHMDADIIDCAQILKNGSSEVLMHHPLIGYSTNPYKDWYYNRICPGSNHSIFKKQLLQDYPYNPQLRRFEDAELLMRVLQIARVYSSDITTSIVNCEYSSASKVRKNIKEDYVGRLSMKGLRLWPKMCVYRIYLENREHYPEEMQILYHKWQYRYDLLLLHKFLNVFGV